jgi:N-acetylneuraminate synthase
MNTPAVTIGDETLGPTDDTYIIAEIGSNFDGEKRRAKRLIDLAGECGADAAKFQAFKADKIVSEYGFDGLKTGFQEDWDGSVYETYREAELPREWIGELASYTEEQGLDFLCTPYDRGAVDLLTDVGVPAFKIGSGDITWTGLLRYVAEQGLPVILATGASTLAEVERALEVVRSTGNGESILLQCVTNYPSEFESANIRAMSTLAEAFDTPIGYSDHTPGSTVPLGAVSRGACVIEKHFTDDKSRDGPDHSFAMNPSEFERMVTEIRNLNDALGAPRKQIYEEEEETVILQRRCLRTTRDFEAGETITDEDVIALRPAPEDSLEPAHRQTVVGRTVSSDMPRGDHFTWSKI